jgi:hypothetical protein
VDILNSSVVGLLTDRLTRMRSFRRQEQSGFNL